MREFTDPDPVHFSMFQEPERRCHVCKTTKLPDGQTIWVKLNGKYVCSEECEFVMFPHLRAKREANRKDPDRFKKIKFDVGNVNQPKYQNYNPGLASYQKLQTNLIFLKI